MKTRAFLLLALFLYSFCVPAFGLELSTNTVHSVTLEPLETYTKTGVSEFPDVTIRDAKFIDLLIKSINETKKTSLGPGPHGEGISLPGFLCSVKFENKDGKEIYRVNILELWDIIFLNGPALKRKKDPPKPQPVYTKNLLPNLEPNIQEKVDHYGGSPGHNPNFCRMIFRKLFEESAEYITVRKKGRKTIFSGEEKAQPEASQSAPAGKTSQ
jgi:hypothetical protein